MEATDTLYGPGVRAPLAQDPKRRLQGRIQWQIEIPDMQRRPAFGRFLFAFGAQERPLDHKHICENPTLMTWL